MATTRQDIIDGTIRCVYRVGLPAVTMSMIGKEVGILGQGLYNHFDSKDDILSACFYYCKQQIAGLFKGYQLDPQDDLMASVKKLWMLLFYLLCESPGGMCLLPHLSGIYKGSTLRSGARGYLSKRPVVVGRTIRCPLRTV